MTETMGTARQQYDEVVKWCDHMDVSHVSMIEIFDHGIEMMQSGDAERIYKSGLFFTTHVLVELEAEQNTIRTFKIAVDAIMAAMEGFSITPDEDHPSVEDWAAVRARLNGFVALLIEQVTRFQEDGVVKAMEKMKVNR